MTGVLNEVQKHTRRRFYEHVSRAWGIEITAHVKLLKLAVNSSFKYCTSSTISSSDHFRVERLLTKGRSLVTNIAGRFASGAFETRFWE